MPLNVYLSRESVPEELTIIDANDDMFIVIPQTDLARHIVKTIDSGTVTSEYTYMVDDMPHLGNLSASSLSTGSKTLINILSNPKVCYNVIECGMNALQMIPLITEGNILWEVPFVSLSEDNVPCNIYIAMVCNLMSSMNFSTIRRTDD